ncbi:OLC1v1035346C1 [Oldenlandia corymbosa var. corymbosa]|uniref:OLC1v1035346C1 n=1 Tax=Oldenlandia corymbosa var. corymbosa TaxID=529605 RepID=A0AAV1CTM5_OLDCO|nr:OLC1v1035346C1 [Oldenlandia corymbosa var. corymbosa]
MDKISIAPFNRLVKLAARAFYDDDIITTTKGENQPKNCNGRIDNRGIAVVVLDALTRRQWVKEEDLAKALNLHSKQLRCTLSFLESEKVVTRHHRKEKAKGREGDDKIKFHIQSFCCLDYAQMYDVLRYRLHRMRNLLKDKLDNKNTVQQYSCPNCGKTYTALDAFRLVSMEDDYFHCENCNGQLVVQSEKLTGLQVVGGRRDKLEAMLKKMESQLKPLTDQLYRVKDLPVPEFRSLLAWEADQANTDRANSDHLDGNIDPSKPKAEENIKSSETSTTQGVKVIPPWLINQGMNLTKVPLGKVTEEVTEDGTKTAVELSEEKKPVTENKDVMKTYQDEYLKAYYEALMKRQLEQEAANRDMIFPNYDVSNRASRQVGMKSKHEEEDDGDDVESNRKRQLLQAQPVEVNEIKEVDDSGNDDDDGLDWEDG